jgi:hypothetical protein
MGLGAGMTVGQAWLLDDVISLVSTRPFSGTSLPVGPPALCNL